MKNSFLFLLCLMFILQSCEDSNSDIKDTTVDGKTFVISSYVISEGIDLNGDGVYSFDIFNEVSPCSGSSYQLSFVNEKIEHPAWIGYSFDVEEDSSGNLEQRLVCGFLDGILPKWEQVDNTLNIYGGEDSNELELTGTIADDGQSITFNVPFENSALSIASVFNDILTESGEVVEYQSSIKLTYTLVE